RAAERFEQRLLWIPESPPQRFEPAPPGLPHRGRGHEQARIIGRLQQKAQDERIAVDLGQLEPEASPARLAASSLPASAAAQRASMRPARLVTVGTTR